LVFACHTFAREWYGFKPSQKAFLEAGSDSWLALEGESERTLVLMPYRVVETLLPQLGVTPDVHWHFLLRLNGGRVLLWLGDGAEKADLTEYVIPPTNEPQFIRHASATHPESVCRDAPPGPISSSSNPKPSHSITRVTPEELIDFVCSRGHLELHTLHQKHPFTVRTAADGLEYLPQTDKPRPHEHKYLQRVCEEFSRTNSFSPGDYGDITMNASYTLALIRAYLDAQRACSNQSMKPTAPDEMTTSVFATTPCRGLSLSR
jgi:hypothetical protein